MTILPLFYKFEHILFIYLFIYLFIVWLLCLMTANIIKR